MAVTQEEKLEKIEITTGVVNMHLMLSIHLSPLNYGSVLIIVGEGEHQGVANSRP